MIYSHCIISTIATHISTLPFILFQRAFVNLNNFKAFFVEYSSLEIKARRESTLSWMTSGSIVGLSQDAVFASKVGQISLCLQTFQLKQNLGVILWLREKIKLDGLKKFFPCWNVNFLLFLKLFFLNKVISTSATSRFRYMQIWLYADVIWTTEQNEFRTFVTLNNPFTKHSYPLISLIQKLWTFPLYLCLLLHSSSNPQYSTIK